MPQPQNPKILRNVPRFHPGKIFFHFDITYPYTIIGLTIHINFDLPTHTQDVQQPIKDMLCVLDLQENRLLQNFSNCSFGSYRGSLQISIDIGPIWLTLRAVNGRFVFRSQNRQLLEWP